MKRDIKRRIEKLEARLLPKPIRVPAIKMEPQRSFGGALELIKQEMYERIQCKPYGFMNKEEKAEYSKLKKVCELLECIRDVKFIQGKINALDAHKIICHTVYVLWQEERF